MSKKEQFLTFVLFGTPAEDLGNDTTHVAIDCPTLLWLPATRSGFSAAFIVGALGIFLQFLLFEQKP